MDVNVNHYLINGKSNGEEFGSSMALHPPTFLHQSHHNCAEYLLFLGVVLFVQPQPVLRVGPKRV